jgi:hypothetical protein
VATDTGHSSRVNLVILDGAHDFRGRDASYLAPTGSPEAVARPAPTERGARFSRTTLFGSWFTAFTAICSSFVSTVG